MLVCFLYLRYKHSTINIVTLERFYDLSAYFIILCEVVYISVWNTVLLRTNLV